MDTAFGSLGKRQGRHRFQEANKQDLNPFEKVCYHFTDCGRSTGNVIGTIQGAALYSQNRVTALVCFNKVWTKTCYGFTAPTTQSHLYPLTYPMSCWILEILCSMTATMPG